MLFLVKGEVTTSRYMGEREVEVVIRLVEAESCDDAAKKFQKHYTAQTRDYDIYVYASVDDVSEVIS